MIINKFLQMSEKLSKTSEQNTRLKKIYFMRVFYFNSPNPRDLKFLHIIILNYSISYKL